MKLRNTLLAGAVATILAAPAFAQVQTLNAFENADVDTTFDLSFDALGINTTSRVIYTRFDLDIDPTEGTAAFTSYEQEIEPLTLPLGISTGRLKVEIISSEGSYNANFGTFETNDVYRITFENDLSFFGFESPVDFPAVSTGTVRNVGEDRFIDMDWQGAGQFENADNPSEPFEYNYACEVSTVVANNLASIPPIPTTQSCASGVLGIFGFATFGMGFMGMKRRIRRNR